MWKATPMLAVLLAGSTSAGSPGVPLDVAASARADVPVAVIVHLRGGAEGVPVPSRRARSAWLTQLHAGTRAELEAWGRDLAAQGATHVRVLWVGHALAAEVPPALLARLQGDPRVASLAADRVVRLPPPQPAADLLTPWNLQRVGAPALWARGAMGAGVVVGLLDSGADGLHPELAGSFRGGAHDWFDPIGHSARPGDAFGHGTQALGLAVGQSTGVAPGATWIAARIFDDTGAARLSTIHQALQWVLDPDGDPATDDGADVVSNSWDLGDDGLCDAEFDRDLRTLALAGVAVVFAAGNGNGAPGSSQSPASSPFSFSVGATTRAQGVAPFSARGPSACDGRPFPDLLAPGTDVGTTDLFAGGGLAGAFTQVSGTSFAAPQVAGGIALLLGAFPARTIQEIEAALRTSARPSPAHDGSGGELDLDAAFRLLQAEDAPRAHGVGVIAPGMTPRPAASAPLQAAGCAATSAEPGAPWLSLLGLLLLGRRACRTPSPSWRST